MLKNAPLALALTAAGMVAAGAAFADPSESYKETGYSAFAEIVLGGYDRNGDGVLAPSEFDAAMRDLAPGETDADTFYAIDTNADGALDTYELSAWQDDNIDRMTADFEANN